MMINDIRVNIEKGSFSAADAARYIEQIKKTSKFTLKKITFSRSDDFLDIRYSFREIPFERLRRLAFTPSSEKQAVNN